MRAFEGKDRKILAAGILIFAALFYLGIGILDGPIWCVDSESYVSMDFFREPVYPTFLFILRSCFGQSIYRNDLPVYLFVAMVLQSVLWIYATYFLSMYVYDLSNKRFSSKRVAYFMAILTGLFSVYVPVLNRFIVKRQSMYSESIMTESIAMPLFIICCIRLSKWLENRKIRDLMHLAVLSFIIISTRKQMMVVLLLWFVTAFFIDIVVKHSRDFKRFLVQFLLIVVIFYASKLFDCTYNYFVRGVFHEHTGNGMGAMCTLMYSTGEEDAELFLDEGEYPMEKQLFIDIYNECSAQGLLIDSARDMNWIELTEHYADSYDVIGYNIASPACYDYLKERNPDIEYNQLRVLESNLEKDIVKKLIKQDKKDLFVVAMANLIKAFVYSNAKPHPVVLIIVSALLYLIYAVLLIKRIIVDLKSKYFDGITVYATVVITALAINSVVVGLIIFPQGRYMAYATGMFYSAMTLMLGDLALK